MDRLSDSSLPLWRRSTVHLWRHWRDRQMDLVRPGQSPLPGCRLPIRGLDFRSHRPSICRDHWRRLRLSGNDHLLDRKGHERLHRRDGVRGNRSRYQRTYRSCGDVGAGSNGEAWQIRRRPHLHHHPLLPVRPVGPAYCVLQLVALHRSAVRDLERHRSDHDRRLLLPSTSSQQHGHESEGGSSTD